MLHPILAAATAPSTGPDILGLLGIGVILLIAFGGGGAAASQAGRSRTGAMTIPDGSEATVIGSPIPAGSRAVIGVAATAKAPIVTVVTDAGRASVPWTGVPRSDGGMSAVVPEGGITLTVTPGAGETTITWAGANGRNRSSQTIAGGQVASVAMKGSGLSLIRADVEPLRPSGAPRR